MNKLNNKSLNSLKCSKNSSTISSNIQQSSPKITFENFLGQGRMNQLGGVFINGRPLPNEKRLKIVEMARSGVKPCKISRELKVSHGAVSKILNRFKDTGSISPGQIGGNPRSRISIQAIRQYILLIWNEKINQNNNNISAQQIQQILIQRGICSQKNVPNTSRINRLLKKQKYLKQRNEIINNNNRENKETDSSSEINKQQQILIKPLSHSIENILNKTTINNNNLINLSKEIQKYQSSTNCVSSEIIILNKFNDFNNKAISAGSDEENYQQQPILTPENRRARTAFNQEQLSLLENIFNENPYPLAEQKEWLVKATNLDEDKIITWFSNRRARSRRKALQNGIPNFQNFFIEANNFLLPKIKEGSSVNLINKNNFINQKLVEKTINNNNNKINNQQEKQQIFNNNNGILFSQSFNNNISSSSSNSIPSLLPFFPSFPFPPTNIATNTLIY